MVSSKEELELFDQALLLPPMLLEDGSVMALQKKMRGSAAAAAWLVFGLVRINVVPKTSTSCHVLKIFKEDTKIPCVDAIAMAPFLGSKLNIQACNQSLLFGDRQTIHLAVVAIVE